jgi:hypothetical protein
LNTFYSCPTNGLSVNAEKCSQITFSHRKLNLKFNYTINSSDLTVVTQIKDLGILLSNYLSFNNHINMICNKALWVLSFIRRNCSEFKNPNCIKILYFSLVRSILEYGSVVWNPYQANLITKIERIQYRLLRVLIYKTKKINLSLKQLSLEFDIESLDKRRKLTDVLWLHKLLNSQINCPELLNLTPLNVPCVNTRVLYTVAYIRGGFPGSNPSQG